MKPNRYPENPYPPGTYLAAHWDMNEAFRLLGAELGKTLPGRSLYWSVKKLNAFAEKVSR